MNKTIHIVLGTAVLSAISAAYFLLAQHDRSGLSLFQWILLFGFTLVLGLAAFLPSLLRRWRGSPQEAVSPSDFKFSLLVGAILCPLVILAVWTLGPVGSFAIMLAPIAFILRSPRRGESRHN